MKKLLIAFILILPVLASLYAFTSKAHSSLPPNEPVEYNFAEIYSLSTTSMRMFSASSVSASAITVAYNSSLINVSVLDNQMVNLRIEDATGGIVYTKAFNSSNTHQLLIDVSDWDSGKYKIVFMNTAGEDSLYGLLYI